MVELRALIPPIIAELDRGKPWQDWRSGAVLFCDVSGFTALSETLAVLGAEGAEILTDILNRYFAEMISIVNAHGGQVMKFGGDAILCFFPESGRMKAEGGDADRQAAGGRQQEEPGFLNLEPETWNLEPGGGRAGESLPRACHAAWKMQEAMTRFRNIKTPVKRFALRMKIGITHGEVLLAGVGDPSVRCDYIFAGDPVDRAAEAEHRAAAGEIVLAAPEFQVSSFKFQVEKLEEGFWRVLEATSQLGTRSAERGDAAPQPETRDTKLETVTPSAFSLQPSALQPYLINEVYQMIATGHAGHVGTLLEAVPVFARFSGFSFRREAFDLGRLHAFFSALMRSIRQYDGRLNRLSMGDKGSTLLLLFGAPNPLEQKERLACQWALDAMALAAGDFPEVELSIGMHTGRLFSGIVGARDRAEYTVMGDAVNLAARLMERAGPGQICGSGDLAGRAEEHFVFDPLGSVHVKGKETPVEVFHLRQRRRQTRVLQTREPLVAREREMEVLSGLLEGAMGGAPVLAVLEGEAGVGKSFLAGHLLDRARKARWRIVPARGEITRSTHAYAPWAELLRTLLFGGRDPDWKTLEGTLGGALSPYLPWFARLFEIAVPGGVTSPAMDEETRKNLFHHQVCDLVLDRAARQPLLIFLDDLHWFDTLSLDLLSGMLNHLKGHRIFILATTRPAWNSKGIAGRPGCHIQPLATMDRASVKALAEEALKGPVRDELAGFLLEKAGGNPFFTRELITHLAEEKFLVSRMGEWLIDRAAELKALPTGSDLVVSHLERLDVRQQIHMRMAACMGPTFSLEVFREALGRSFSARVLESILRLGHFQRLAGDGCTFPHALVQESLYQSIPLRQRRLNHRRIAAAMEKVHVDQLDAYAPNLANHHHLAGNRAKTVDYSLRAGRDLFERLSFPEACTYYERAYRLLLRSSNEKKYSVGLSFARALFRVGRLKESQMLAAWLSRETSLHAEWGVMHAEAQLAQFQAMERLGNYRYVRQARMLLEHSTTLAEEVRLHLHYLLGFALMHRGDYDAAEAQFHAMLDAGSRLRDIALIAFLPLASIEKSRGRNDRAFHLVGQGIATAREAHHLYHELRLRIEYANISLASGALDQAEEYFKSALAQTEEIGDFYLLANIYYNLGKLHLNRGDLDRAEILLKESADLCLNLGIVIGQANAMMHLGIVYFYRQSYFDAYTYYFEAVHLFESIREIPELCYGYFNLAEVCLMLEKTEEARDWHQKGMKLFSLEDNPGLYGMYEDLAKSLALRSRRY